MTWSPGFTVVTPAPHSAISPAASWPGTIGRGDGQSPFMTCQSLWQTPEAFILTRTSPALGGSSSQSTTCNGSLGLNRTAAFIAFPPDAGHHYTRRKAPWEEMHMVGPNRRAILRGGAGAASLAAGVLSAPVLRAQDK